MYSTLIEAEQAHAILNDANVVFLDCRFNLMEPRWGRQQYLDSHIPGAYYLDLNHDLSSPVIKGITGRHPLPHPEIISAVLAQAGIDEKSQVIVYDQLNGGYAARAWWILQWLGVPDTAVLNGGIIRWKELGFELDNQWPAPKDTGWKGTPDPDMIIQKEDLVSVSKTIIDSREFKRYKGIEEPIDPIAGHIPNAICFPFIENTKPDGRWLSQEDLKQRFSDIQDTPIFYCGSGVTACHNLLSFKIATDKMAILYPGSWSEWIQYYPPA